MCEHGHEHKVTLPPEFPDFSSLMFLWVFIVTNNFYSLLLNYKCVQFLV